MSASTSLAVRAVLALVLMIGFYILALAIASGLLYLPYAEMTYAHRVHPKLALICIIGALAILWSVLPRLDKFTAPGPRLTREQHPRLFDEIETVAGSVQQAPPAEVYLVPELNAWVTQRGGLMGFGSRRVMGLGLPLMRILSRPEFRAVLAHEFGHYHGGNTKLGPWIYKTRGAIGRTLSSLGDGSLLQLPFQWYGKIFLRITHAISRRQEFVADELAARSAGSKPLISGLRTIHGVAPAFNAYWSNECAPVLEAGFHPPLTEGFQRFVQVTDVADVIQKRLEEELKTGQVDPYDTHPPLKERIAAVEHLPPGSTDAETSPATSLLSDILTLETELLATMAGPESAAKLKVIDWGQVCDEVYLPRWTAMVEANSTALSGLKVEDLPRVAADLAAFGLRCRTPQGESPDSDRAARFGTAVLGSALTLRLVEEGGRVDTLPGEDVWVHLAGQKIAALRVIPALSEGKLSAADWERRCQELGITGSALSR